LASVERCAGLILEASHDWAVRRVLAHRHEIPYFRPRPTELIPEQMPAGMAGRATAEPWRR